MRLIIAALLALPMLSGIAVAGDQDCKKGCDELNKRHTSGVGGPNRYMVCLRLLMRDPLTAVWMTVKYSDGRTHREEYPRGSAAHAAGSPKRLPLFCIHEAKLRSAISAEICTATNGDGGSTTLREVHIKRLFVERSIPESEPACLLGLKECAQIRADPTAGR